MHTSSRSWLILLVLAASSTGVAAGEVRERASLNAGWRFQRFTSNPDSLSYDILKPWILPSANKFVIDGVQYKQPNDPAPGSNASFVKPQLDDSTWQQVTLPHDWAIAGPFNAPGVDGDRGRLPIDGVGWYRRKLEVQQQTLQSNKSVYLDIDGAMAYSAVWLNGQLVGGWPFGYNSFRLELTSYLKVGENQLAIRLDNAADASRWYPGAGLYRNVWLVTVSPVHVAQYGTYVTTPEVSTHEATIDLAIEIENAGAVDQDVEIVTEVFALDSASRQPVGDAIVKFAPVLTTVVGQTRQIVNGSVKVEDPKLWGPPPTQYPNEYTAITTISTGKALVDAYHTFFGIRSIVYNATQGFYVNGERIPIRGTCNHHDLGSLGAAFNKRAAERQVQALQEMGSNALRTSHNPPAPEFLEIADRLGFLVMDEAFDTWNEAKVPNDFHRIFPEWHEPDVRSFIRRDRNHPSIISWSIGNELPEQSTDEGTVTATMLQSLVHDEDRTRLVTLGLNNAGPDTGIAAAIDIIGLNYQGEGKGDSWFGSFGSFRSKFPDKMIWTTESASTVSSRGVYTFPVTSNKSAVVGGGRGEGGDPVKNHVSSYDLYAPSWAASPDKVFEQQDRAPYVAGEFVWTGWDYIGEPTPYANESRSSYFGIIDLAGFKKDRFYLYQARWRPDLAQAHILPHWTWPGREGEITPIHVYTSGDEAELIVNGESAGRKKRSEYDYRIRWDNVMYAPGEIRILAWKNGEEWASASHRTVGGATSLKIAADRTNIANDGDDLAFISVAVVDANGDTVPQAGDWITFSVVSGPGEIISTDNGDPRDQTEFPSKRRKAFSGLALAVLRATPGTSGEIVVKAEADGLIAGVVNLHSM